MATESIPEAKKQTINVDNNTIFHQTNFESS